MIRKLALLLAVFFFVPAAANAWDYRDQCSEKGEAKHHKCCKHVCPTCPPEKICPECPVCPVCPPEKNACTVDLNLDGVLDAKDGWIAKKRLGLCATPQGGCVKCPARPHHDDHDKKKKKHGGDDD